MLGSMRIGERVSREDFQAWKSLCKVSHSKSASEGVWSDCEESEVEWDHRVEESGEEEFAEGLD